MRKALPPNLKSSFPKNKYLEFETLLECKVIFLLKFFTVALKFVAALASLHSKQHYL
jgi:hypothetical protein